MRKYIKIKYIIFTIAITSVLSYGLFPLTACAWGDNGGGRPSYTEEEIDNGAIGATEISDGENYKKTDNYPGTIVFNSISNGIIGDEKNFVGARECFQRADGTWIGATKDTIWNPDEIEVEDGHTYIIRMYVHNNNPNGEDAVAKNTKISFILPIDSAKEIEVNGIINSSNATPSRYWDHVTFKSSNLFHLEYIENTALLENNGIGKGGVVLSDDLIQADGGILIGYDKLDGRIPGCYQYDGFVTIKVKAVFDYDFIADTQVRLAGEKTWQDTVTANVGDKVEFQIQYKNTSNKSQTHVVLRDILPPNLRYVPGSTKLMDAKYPNGATINEDVLVDDNGFLIGDYSAGSNAYVMFTAEVVDDSLACGQNTLINKGQAYVNDKLLEDRATVIIYKDENYDFTSAQTIQITAIIIGISICIVILIWLIYKIIKFNRRK